MPMMNMEKNTVMTDLTGVIRLIPNQYGLVNSLGIFSQRGTPLTSITIDRVDDDMTLLDSVTRGARGVEYNNGEVVQQYAFPIPYFTDFERITPDELQGVREAGTMDLKRFDTVRARKLQKLRMRHDMTMEFMKMQALKGKVVDANGRVFADLFTTYGYTKKTFNFELGNDATNVSEKCREVVRYIEDNAMMGGAVNGENIYILVDSIFFDKLVKHPSIKEAYLFYQSTQEPLRDSLRATDGYQKFTHAGLTFVEYRGQFKDKRGQVHKLVSIAGKNEGVGHAFPNLGAMNSETYPMFSAPARKMEYVNTLGQELYTFEYELARGEGYEYEYHSSNLPLCLRPQMLIDVLATGN